MRRQKLMVFGVVFLVLIASGLLQAEEKKQNFYGSFSLGYRSVSTDGTIEKYKEDINLDDGVRLLNFNFHFRPETGMKKIFDQLDVSLFNFGGDPFESFQLNVAKYGVYDFSYNRRKSAYYYADQHEVNGALYNPNSFDFERLSDSGQLKVWLLSGVQLYLDFTRYKKKGESITTLDINRIEFEFDRPIDEESKEIVVGVNAQLARQFSLVLEERRLEFETTNSFFLPGYADGGPFARYPSSLEYFNQNQPYSLDSATHSLKFSAQPFNWLVITGNARLIDQDLDLTYSEAAEGINYLGRYFAYAVAGEGSFDRKIGLYDVDLSLFLTKRLALVGAVRYKDFEQSGNFTVNGETNSMSLNYDTLGFEGGLQYQFSSAATVTLGYRNEERTLDGVETITYEEKTRHQGLFGNISWRPSRTFRWTADYQFRTYDEPFTLISPTDFHRFRTTANFHVKDFAFTATYLLTDIKSEVYEDKWTSSRNQFSLRGTYTHGIVRASLGYAYHQVKHEADRLVEYPPYYSVPGPGAFPWDIRYEGKSSLFDGMLALSLNQTWRIVGYFNLYSNSGFWEIDRKWFKGQLEYTLPNGIIASLGYRYVDFKEKMSGFNDYSANIVELSFGYRWK